MARTGIPGQLEYFVAYAGSATIAIAGYERRGAVRIIGLFLDIRRHSGVLLLFLGPASVDHGFCGIGARSVLRRDRCSPLRALSAEGRRFGRHLI